VVSKGPVGGDLEFKSEKQTDPVAVSGEKVTSYYAMDDLFKVPDFTTWPGVAQLREHDSSRDDCIFPIIQVFELFKRDLEEEWAVG